MYHKKEPLKTHETLHNQQTEKCLKTNDCEIACIRSKSWIEKE